jgi:hypothetical protein
MPFKSSVELASADILGVLVELRFIVVDAVFTARGRDKLLSADSVDLLQQQ